MVEPVNKVDNIDIPYDVLVRRADPNFERERHRELQYDFPKPGRFFYADPDKSGPYAPEEE